MGHPTILLALALTAAGCARRSRPGADVIITNADVWTGVPAARHARAVAIAGDRVVDVGSTDVVERWRDSSTRIVDAEGRRVIPGIHARARVVEGGLALDRVSLGGAPTALEFARRIGERAKSRPGEWVLGGEWDNRSWQPPDLPTRQLIDDATNGTPVFVRRADATMALANSAALGRAGITERTPDPPGGTIVRDARRFPTGLLIGTAMAIVERVVPNATPDERERAVKRTLEYAATAGVTTLEDVSPSAEDVAIYTRLAGRNELSVRIATAQEGAGRGVVWPKATLNRVATLTADDALAALTGGDVLAAGRPADVALLGDSGALMTIVGGKIVHQRKP